MKKIAKTIFLLLFCINLHAQWDIANGIVDWTPDNSPGMPAPGFYHNTVIIASLNITISGGANVQDINGNSNYPLCPGAKTTIIFSLSGGATFSGTTANDAVSTSGDWESRFTWSYSLGKTVLTAVQSQVIPTNVDPGTFNTFNFNVLTPNYTSNFTFSTQVIKGTGTPDCRVNPGNTNDRDPNTTTSNDAQSINGFTNRSLPIQLLSFQTLDKEEAGIGLTWKTLNESNTAKFEIERMYDGKSNGWVTVGSTKAAGFTNTERTYAYMDKTYAKAERIYYRVKQIDGDGSFKYTDIKSIQLKEYNKLQLNGYPNPVTGMYHLNLNVKEDAKLGIEMIDILGRSVAKETIQAKTGFNNHDIDFSSMPSGTYFVKVTGGDLNNSLTVIKTE